MPTKGFCIKPARFLFPYANTGILSLLWIIRFLDCPSDLGSSGAQMKSSFGSTTIEMLGPMLPLKASLPDKLSSLDSFLANPESVLHDVSSTSTMTARGAQLEATCNDSKMSEQEKGAKHIVQIAPTHNTNLFSKSSSRADELLCESGSLRALLSLFKVFVYS